MSRQQRPYLVTITGADDDVDPRELVALSARYDFVEWGILFSRKRGRPRFPSVDWVDELVRASARDVRPPRLSAHFCGTCTRETLQGSPWWVLGLDVLFKRVQLNGFAPTQEVVDLMHAHPAVEYILQARDEATLRAAAEVAGRLYTSAVVVSALWDVSGGRGVEPDTWPDAPRIEAAALPLGYAGGIGPETVDAVLAALESKEHEFWIDMETGVRDDTDKFDVSRAQAVLDCVARWRESE